MPIKAKALLNSLGLFHVLGFEAGEEDVEQGEKR